MNEKQYQIIKAKAKVFEDEILKQKRVLEGMESQLRDLLKDIYDYEYGGAKERPRNHRKD